MSNWERVFVCSNCDNIQEAYPPCRECGAAYSAITDTGKSARWISTAIWWKPSTWFRGYWQLNKLNT